MKNQLTNILEKLFLKLKGIEYGSVTLTLTIHQGNIAKVEYVTSEKEVSLWIILKSGKQ